MKRVAGLAMSFALAACSNQATPTPAASARADGAPHVMPRKTAKVDEKQAMAAMDKAAADDPAGAAKRGLPVATPTPRRLADTTLPTAFQGHWGIKPGDCDMSRVDDPGRLGIEGNKLVFYEGTRTVTSLAKASGSDVSAEVEYKDGGQTRTTHTRFALATGGTVLLRSEQSPVKTYRYSRC